MNTAASRAGRKAPPAPRGPGRRPAAAAITRTTVTTRTTMATRTTVTTRTAEETHP
ncbi:hypothetical protein [Streptomyces sp. NPDC002209]|uniref:hypothetical protein n=1 Tax=Streptomyces sp. NPDC002209 TaxID=3364638 RepID=UPI0036AE1F65